MNKENQFRWSQVSWPCLIRTLLKNCWMVIASGIVFALIVSLVLTWTYKPQYRANMTYAVTIPDSNFSAGSSLTAAREVAVKLSEMLTTPMIYEGIRGSDTRLASFDGTIQAAQIGESNFISVSATADTPEQAFLALSTLQTIFPTVAEYVAKNYVLTIMVKPTVSAHPINPSNTQKLSAIAGAAGAVLMIGLIGYISITRNTIQTRSGAHQLLDAPILASLGHEKKNRTFRTRLKRTNKHVQVFSPAVSFSYADQINAACNQMEHEHASRGRRVFLVTGIGESEGKSTVAGNLAAGLALKGRKVILLDCDLRKPAQNKFFDNEYQSELPLNKLLAEPFSFSNVDKCIYHSARLSLDMMFPVKSDGRSAELLSGETMKLLIPALDAYEFVIFDTPPMGMFPDAEILADLVDASMLVVRQDYVPACDINDSIDTLKKYKGSFLGVILNDMLSSHGGLYGYGRYGYGKYGYGYGYGYGEKKSGSEHSHHSHHREGDAK